MKISKQTIATLMVMIAVAYTAGFAAAKQAAIKNAYDIIRHAVDEDGCYQPRSPKK